MKQTSRPPLLLSAALLAFLVGCADDRHHEKRAGITGEAPALLDWRATPAIVPHPDAGSVYSVRLEARVHLGEAPLRVLKLTWTRPDGSTTERDEDNPTLRLDDDGTFLGHTFAVRADTAVGTHTFEAQVVDEDGAETDFVTTSFEVTESGASSAPLVVTALSAESVEPGDELLLIGRGFGDDPDEVRVTSNGAVFPVVSVEDEALRVEVSELAVSGPLKVEAPSGAVVTSAAIQVAAHVWVDTPARKSVQVGERLRLTGHVRGVARPALEWRVNGIPGGSETYGTIDEAGVYYAPLQVPAELPVLITLEVPELTAHPGGSVEVHLHDPCAQTGVAEVGPQTAASIVDPQGRVRIDVPAGRVTELAELSLTSALPSTTESFDGELLRFSLHDPAEKLSSGDLPVLLMLPIDPDEETQVRIYAPFPGGGLDFESERPVDFEEGRAAASIDRAGDYVVVAHHTPPTASLPSMFVSGIYAPDAVDMDPTAGAVLVKEGRTFPVRVDGLHFDGAPLTVRVASTSIDGQSVDASRHFTIGPVKVDDKGEHLGFTLNMDAIEILDEGSTMFVSLVIEKLGYGAVETAPSALRIHGLNELVVSPTSNRLYTADGVRIDHYLFEAECTQTEPCPNGSPDCAYAETGCYSKIQIRPGATLGIGRPVSQVFLPTGEGFAEHHLVDVATLGDAEALLGRFAWIDDVDPTLRDDGQLFAPLDVGVQLDVTADVEIGGTLYLGGMRGGDKRDLPLADPPEDSSHARTGLHGGWVYDVAHDQTRASGGLGGSGGIGANPARAGESAGGSDAQAALGRDAWGAVPQGIVFRARGGRGLDQGTIPLLGYFNNVINTLIGGVRTAMSVISGSPPSASYPNLENADALLGDTMNTNFRDLETQKAYFERLIATYDEARALGDRLNVIGPLLPSPGAADYRSVSQNYEYLSGQGGHSGLRADLINAFLADNAALTPGGGGGGGGGGGSSTLVEAFPDAVPIIGGFEDITMRIGGGGAGGGGAAGSLRITAGRRIHIGPAARVIARGGRGGFGQRHVLLAGNGGGGGGGAGGVLKLQAPTVDNDGTIDLSGGDLGGAALDESGIPLPSCGRVQVLDGQAAGGFLHYSTNRQEIYVAYPTGRLRSRLQQIAVPFAGIGVAIENGVPSAKLLVVEPTTKRIWRTGAVDYNSGQLLPVNHAFGDDLGTALAALPGFVPSDIAQDPLPPHNIYVSGHRVTRRLGAYKTFADSMIVELSASGQLIGVPFNVQTCDRCEAGVKTPGHLTDIDFLTSGALVGMMTRRSPVVRGLYTFDRSTGAIDYVRVTSGGLVSMSVFRDAHEDHLGVTWCNPTVAVENTPPRVNFRLLKQKLDGDPVGQITMVLESMGWPGQPGLGRIDGLSECSDLPQVDVRGLPARAGLFRDVTHFEPTVGAIEAPRTGLLDSLVVRRPYVAAYVHGADSMFEVDTFEVQVRSAFGVGTTHVNVDRSGTLFDVFAVQPGFNAVYASTNVGGNTHPLLERHVLYLED